jgi:hypothetical protein
MVEPRETIQEEIKFSSPTATVVRRNEFRFFCFCNSEYRRMWLKIFSVVFKVFREKENF